MPWEDGRGASPVDDGDDLRRTSMPDGRKTRAMSKQWFAPPRRNGTRSHKELGGARLHRRCLNAHQLAARENTRQATAARARWQSGVKSDRAAQLLTPYCTCTTLANGGTGSSPMCVGAPESPSRQEYRRLRKRPNNPNSASAPAHSGRQCGMHRRRMLWPTRAAAGRRRATQCGQPMGPRSIPHCRTDDIQHGNES